LFGAGNGTTLGSYGGRVDQFLASLAPDIGSNESVQVAQAQPKMDSPLPTTEQPAVDTWVSNAAQSNTGNSNAGHAVDTEVKTVSNTLLEPPAFDELEQITAEQATPLQPAVSTGSLNANVPAGPHLAAGQGLPFEKIKTFLAAFGLFSIAVMLLKAAG
jgi:hypothetical protein